MAEYSKSKSTRTTVLNAARKLFYKEGYINTRNSDIEQLTGMNAALIYYHFGNKGNLAGNIYAQISDSVISSIQKIFQEELTPILTIGVTMVILARLSGMSKQYARFLHEISKERIPSRMVLTNSVSWFERCGVTPEQSNLDEMTLRKAVVTIVAMETEITLARMEGYVDITDDEMAEYDIQVLTSLLRYHPDEITSIIRDSFRMADSLSVKVRSGFVIDIKKK